MDTPSFVGFFLVVFLSFVCLSQAYTFYVGGKEGWILKPSESYDHWAERNRFQVNDTIVFKYKRGSDSVLVVHNKEDYLKCNKEKPIHKLKNGNSKLKFTRSGAFYFISGKDDNCEKGQKLHVVVISPNHKRPKSPIPATQPPASSPVTPPPAASPSVATPPPAASPSVVTPPPAATPSVVTPPPAATPSVVTPPSQSLAPAPTKSAAVHVGSSSLVWLFSLITATVFYII